MVLNTELILSLLSVTCVPSPLPFLFTETFNSCGATAVPSALLAVATSTLQLIGIRIIQGVAVAAIAAPAYALGADMSSEGGEGRQMSILSAGFMMGLALGPLAAGVLAAFSFSLPFLVGGV